jgi:hypothetical protein
LLDAVEILRQHRIDYAVIGAMAAAAHGAVRASVDADAVVSLAVKEAPNLRDAFTNAGFRAELRRGDFEDPIAAVLELQDDHGNRVDLLIGLRGMPVEVFQRAVEVPFCGETLRVVSREDLIAMKLFAGGPQDLLDAKHIRSIDPAALDVRLLATIVGRYGKDASENLAKLLAD